uniref:Uncharacterized protein n=1 Tax=Marmota marmota marmota TaxID=9994 RepID=A0A8C6EZ30_MARMA
SFCFCLFFLIINEGIHLLVERTGLQHVAILHFAVTLLQAFEFGSTLFWCPQEATLSQLFSHSPIQLALPMTGLKCFIKPSFTKNIKKSLGFFVAPMHTYHSR